MSAMHDHDVSQHDPEAAERNKVPYWGKRIYAIRDLLIEKGILTADDVQAILRPFEHVTVLHGHTHQLLTNRIDNIYFHGMLSTAWPWPYAPEGLPKLTIQQNRADPFDQFDGCGDGSVELTENGLANALYNLWDRNPVTVRAGYLASSGAKDAPPRTKLPSY